MRKIFRARNMLLLLIVLPIVLILGDFALFAYRMNNLCGPGDHIVQSESDVIETAKSRVFQARYGAFYGEEPDSVDFSHTDNCCKAVRTRTPFGVIVWKISLEGETARNPAEGRHVSAQMELSNCGVVFDEDSLITAVPVR